MEMKDEGSIIQRLRSIASSWVYTGMFNSFTNARVVLIIVIGFFCRRPSLIIPDGGH